MQTNNWFRGEPSMTDRGVCEEPLVLGESGASRGLGELVLLIIILPLTERVGLELIRCGDTFRDLGEETLDKAECPRIDLDNIPGLGEIVPDTLGELLLAGKIEVKVLELHIDSMPCCFISSEPVSLDVSVCSGSDVAVLVLIILDVVCTTSFTGFLFFLPVRRVLLSMSLNQRRRLVLFQFFKLNEEN